MELYSDRLYLRRFLKSDLGSLQKLEGDELVMNMTGPARAQSPSESDARLTKILEYRELVPCCGYWAGIEKSSEELVAWFMLLPDLVHKTQFELGFMVRRDCWGKGYASELAQVLCQEAKKYKEISLIVAKTHKQNIASQKVLKKCGFTIIADAELLIFKKDI